MLIAIYIQNPELEVSLRLAWSSDGVKVAAETKFSAQNFS